MVTKKKKSSLKNTAYIPVSKILVILCIILGIFFLIVSNNTRKLASSFLSPETTYITSSTNWDSSTTEIPTTSDIEYPAETTEPSSTSDVSSTTSDDTEHKPWEPAPETDIIWYKVYCGKESWKHSEEYDVWLVMSTIISKLECDTQYYCVVVAYNADWLTSMPSAEISYRTPPCPSPGDPFEPDPTLFPPVLIPPGSDGVELPVPYPGIPAIKIPSPPSTFDCPPPKVVTAQITSMKLMYSHDLVNWSEYSVPETGFDMDKARDELGMPVFFRVEVVYDYVCVDVSGPPTPAAPGIWSSVLQSSSVGDTFVAEDIVVEKISFWSRLMHFFVSLFVGDSSLKSDTLSLVQPSSSAMIVIKPTQLSVSDPSYRPNGSIYGVGKVKITAQGLSTNDSITITWAWFLGIINTPNTPIGMSVPVWATLTLTANTGSNSSFTSWQGCDSVVGKVCTIIVDGDETITSLFKPLATFTLTTSKAGTGSGTISGNTGTSYSQGTNVVLTATPATNSTFSGWTGCTTVSGTKCTVTMNAAKTVTAKFTLKTYSLSITKTGTGSGTALWTLGASAWFSSGSFPAWSIIKIVAKPATGSTFTGWIGCPVASGTTCTVTMNSAKIVTARFTRK